MQKEGAERCDSCEEEVWFIQMEIDKKVEMNGIPTHQTRKYGYILRGDWQKATERNPGTGVVEKRSLLKAADLIKMWTHVERLYTYCTFDLHSMRARTYIPN